MINSDKHWESSFCLWYMYLLCCLVLAALSSLMYVTAITFPIHYFKKHRQIALMISSAGCTVSFLIFPPLLTHLLKHFAWREANVFIAGICLQVSFVVCKDSAVTIFFVSFVASILISASVIPNSIFRFWLDIIRFFDSNMHISIFSIFSI